MQRREPTMIHVQFLFFGKRVATYW